MKKALVLYMLAVFLFVVTILTSNASVLYADEQQNQPANSDSTSLNWAGYVADTGSYTSVTGSWVVPLVSDSRPGADATWVGIGGVQTRDLIQAGTQAIVGNRGDITYQAWYEVLPDVSTPIDLAISPGNSITTTLSETQPDLWRIQIRNNTTGHTFKKTVSYQSTKNSVEWVEERVSLSNGWLYPLDQFGSVHFTRGSATQDGKNKSIRDLHAYPLTMANMDGTVLASIVPINTSNEFSVTEVQPPPTARNTRVSSIATNISQEDAVGPPIYLITYSQDGNYTIESYSFPSLFNISTLWNQ